MRPISDHMASLTSLNSESVRHIRKTAETPPRLSVLDVISLVTGHSSTVCSHTLQTLLQNYPDVGRHLSYFKFQGQGQRETHVADAHGITEIVMILPGRAAAHVRKQAATVLVRFLGGDPTLVQEIAANRLSQEEMSEGEPCRIFGQAVEGEAVKRKREELTLAGIELELCEQAGALKRRRVESVQFCLHALESCGGADSRDKVRCTDMIREIAFGGSASSAPEDREICLREVINAAGRARENGLDCKVGKLAKKLYTVDHPGYVFPKKSIYANGQLIEANMWLDSQRSYIERALASI